MTRFDRAIASEFVDAAHDLGMTIQIRDDGEIPMPLGDGLLVDAQARDDGLLAAGQPALYRFTARPLTSRHRQSSILPDGR